MRWFKHLAMAHEDKELSALLEEMGPEAYGVYWLLLELIASPMEKNCTAPELTHSELKWSQILHVSVRKFRNYSKDMDSRGLISVSSAGNRIRILIPRLDELRGAFDGQRIFCADWAELREMVFERDDFTCTYCGARGGVLECDHVHPVSRGGSDELCNLATACLPCNRSKKDKTVAEWRQ